MYELDNSTYDADALFGGIIPSQDYSTTVTHFDDSTSVTLTGDTVVSNLESAVNNLRVWRHFTIAMAILAGLGIILGAVYMLSMYRRVLLGPINHVKNQLLEDLSLREWAVMLPLIIAIFAIGLTFPSLESAAVSSGVKFSVASLGFKSSQRSPAQYSQTRR